MSKKSEEKMIFKTIRARSLVFHSQENWGSRRDNEASGAEVDVKMTRSTVLFSNNLALRNITSK